MELLAGAYVALISTMISSMVPQSIKEEKMMKVKGLAIFIMVVMMVAPVMAGKTKTAECKDKVLTDLRYDFTIDVPNNWKTKTFKEKAEKPEVLRALLTQKNYQINQQARELGGDFVVPEIQVYVRPTAMTAAEFFEKLKHDVELRSSDDKIINQMNLILAGEFQGSQEVVLAGNKAIQALFKRPWKRQLQAEADDPKYRAFGGRIVQDIHDVHEVYIFEHDGYLFVINALVENEFYRNVTEEFANIISTLKFPAIAEAEVKE